MTIFNLFTFIGMLLLIPFSGSWAGEKSAGEEARQLRELMYQLQHRVENLEQKQAKKKYVKSDTKPKAPKSTPYLKKTPKSLEVPLRTNKVYPELLNDKVKFSMGGQIFVEAVSNWPSNTIGSEFDLAPAWVPTGSVGENGQFVTRAQESRLWFKSSSITELGLIKTLLEMDFKASASGEERINNSFNPRMRHAFLQIGNFEAGQTTTTFANMLAWPDIMPDMIGQISNRQPMVRWNQRLGKDARFQIALENPETTLTSATGTRIIPADDRVPDLAMKVLWYSDNNSLLSLSGLLREIRSDGAVAIGVEDNAVGGGLYLSGKLKTTGNDNVRFGLAAGNAIGHYASNNSFNDGSIDAAGHIELHMMYIGYLSYQHWLNDHWRIAATASHIQVDNDLDRVPDTIVEHAQSFHLRLSWVPLLSTNFSVEYTHARSELESGLEGEQNRLHFGALYKF
jgi:hypothetical protein